MQMLPPKFPDLRGTSLSPTGSSITLRAEEHLLYESLLLKIETQYVFITCFFEFFNLINLRQAVNRQPGSRPE